MPINKGMLCNVFSGLFDPRISKEDREKNRFYLKMRWALGFLGSAGDWFWKQFSDYFEKYKEPLSLHQLKSSLGQVSQEDSTLILYLIEHLKQTSLCTLSQFQNAVNSLERDYNEVKLLQTISQALTILQNGLKVKDKVVRGFAPAKRFLVDSLKKLEERGSLDSFHNLRDTKEVLQDLSFKNAADIIKTGFNAIDSVIGGGQFGEMALIAGYAGEGKSQFLTNVVWNAVVNQRKTVLVYDGEMSKIRYKRRLICRHSCHPKFGLREGLIYDDIKFGKLDSHQSAKLTEIVDDFDNNSEYGKLFTHGLGKDDHVYTMWQTVESMMNCRVDMVVVDYLTLVPPFQHRSSRREELSETVRAMKSFAKECYDGEGLYLLAAYQTNRQGRERAVEQGFYDLQSLEETSEAEKAADLIMWLLRTQEMEEMNEAKIGIMKSRDSMLLQEAFLYCNFACSYLADVSDSR